MTRNIDFVPTPVTFSPTSEDKPVEYPLTAIMSTGDDFAYDTSDVVGFYTTHRGTGIIWGTISLIEYAAETVNFCSEDGEISYPYMHDGRGHTPERFEHVLHAYIRHIWATGSKNNFNPEC